MGLLSISSEITLLFSLVYQKGWVSYGLRSYQKG